MKVTLDAALLGDTFNADDTLQALIDDVRDARLGDRIVVGVTVDGHALVNQELAERLAAPVGEVDSIELISAHRGALARDALFEAGEQLSAAGAEHTAIADHLQAGRYTEAVEGFARFLNGWQVCQRVLLECSRLLGEDLTQMECVGAPMCAHLNRLADKLREMRDAFEARDTVLLGDLIQYEMPQICSDWRDILRELGAQIAGQPSGAAT